MACWDREALLEGVDDIVGDFTRLSWVSFADGPAALADVDAAIRRVQEQLDADMQHRRVDGLEVLRGHRQLAFPAVFTKIVPDADAGIAPAYAISQTPQVTVDCITRRLSDTELLVQWDSIAADREREAEVFDRYVELIEEWAGVQRPMALARGAVKLPDRGVLLHELFEQRAALHGEVCAVRFQNDALTYRELERRSRCYAQWLQAQGVGPDDIVAVFMERSVELVVALMGILRAGAAYLPLDVGSPEGRVAQICAASQARCLFTQRRFATRWTTPTTMRVCFVEDLDGSEPDSEPLQRRTGENDLAYVIYTSGSTGLPKGCMIEHRSIVNRLAWMQEQFPLEVGDAVLQKTPYSFDVSVWEFFWPLIVGATIVVAKPGGHLDAAYLLDLIERERISVCHFVPSMLRLVMAEPAYGKLAGLQRVIVSGEALDYDLMEQFLDRCGIPLENLYGPTEAAVDVSYWPCRKNTQRQTRIGRAISRVQLYVLDEDRRPVAPGETGELYIGGVAVGRGYLGDPELSARSFVRAPFGRGGVLYKTGDIASFDPEGNILFWGRRDGQIKLNGLRIELSEVEHHLRSYPAVEDVMVTAEGASGNQMLVAFVVQRDKTQPLGKELLRDFLRGRVPFYMIPHVFVPLAEIPLTPHGKRRRIELASVETQSNAVTTPVKVPARGVPSERELIDILRGMI